MNEVYDLRAKSVVSKELRSRIEFVVLDCLDKAQKRFGIEKVKAIPQIRYETKGRAAGLACWNHGKPYININPILLNENVEQMVTQTVPHEVAHIVVFEMYGDSALRTGWGKRRTVAPHGYEWQQVMRVFGLNPDRCHNMDVSSIKKLKKSYVEYVYKCSCKQHIVSSIVNKRITNGKNYRCRECGNRLEYVRTSFLKD